MNAGHIFQLIRSAVIYKSKNQIFFLVDICHVCRYTCQLLRLKQKNPSERTGFVIDKKIKALS